MKLAHVIGRVTLSRQDPAYKGGRFLVVQPYAKEQFAGAPMTPLAKGNSFVVYDNLGASTGNTIGIIEGSEATAPFDNPTPIDALSAAIIDEVFYNPPKTR